MRRIKENLQLISDLCVLNLVLMVLAYQALTGSVATLPELLLMMLAANATWVTIYFIIGHNKPNRSWEYSRHLYEALKLVCIQFFAFYFLSSLLLNKELSGMLSHYYGYALAACILSRFALAWFLRAIRSRGYNFKRVVVVGDAALVKSFADEVNRRTHYGYRLLGSFNGDLEYTDTLGNVSKESKDIYEFLINENIDEVFISVHIRPERIQSLLTFCQLNGIVINITHDFLNGLKLEPMNMTVRRDGLAPTLTIREDWLYSALRVDGKRLFDVVFSLAFLVFIASWLFPVIAFIIKLDSRGPVFFIQRRTGLNNREFLCHKFRTMHLNGDSDEKQAVENDERVTRIGRFLRETNLDELPQFMDVLVGHMSIVGPRPHMLKHTREYSRLVDSYNERLWIKPGITGLAQSLGFRGEIRELSQLAGRIAHDRYYIRNWSFFLDLKIIMVTAWNMLSFQRMGI